MSDATSDAQPNGPAVRLTWFPKPLAGASAGEIAHATRAAGLSRCNAVVREKYPTPPGTLARTLGPWFDALRGEGVACDFATTNWTPGDLAGAESDLAALAEHRVTNVRLAQINSGGKFGGVGDVPAELDAAKRDFDHAARLLEKHGLRGVYQVHFKTLLPSPSSLWPMVADLPAERMAVMLDPGNQMIEGAENPARSMSLFGPARVAAVGVKDLLWERDGDGAPSHKFVPVGEGMVGWPAVLKQLAAGGFGTPSPASLVFHPFFAAAGNDALVSRLAQEVVDVRRHLAAAGIAEAADA